MRLLVSGAPSRTSWIFSAGSRFRFSAPQLSVTGELQHMRPIQVDDFLFVKSCLSNEHSVVKVAIPSPTMVHFRRGRSGIDIESCERSSASASDALTDPSFG